MVDFDPSRACRSFLPEHAGRGRRRPTALLFVEQGGEDAAPAQAGIGAPPAAPSAARTAVGRFVVKSYRDPDEPPAESRARLEREREGEAAFVSLGESVLWPCAGPFERLDLVLDGAPGALEQVLVFPWLPAPTLFDALRAAPRADARAAALLTAVVARIAARHARARKVSDLHSDGAAHNILVLAPPGAGAAGAGGAEPALLWFDFAEPHAAQDVDEARAVELLAFLLSVVEASPAGEERARVAASCAEYCAACAAAGARVNGRAVLERVLALRAPKHPRFYALRRHLRLRSWRALRRGDTTQLARFRLWRALNEQLR